MTESMSREVLPENWQGRIRGDLVGDRDPSRQTLFLLLDALEHHVRLEAEAFRLCEHLARASHDPVIVLIMRRMLEDEEHHQALLRRISSRLGDALNVGSSDTLPRTIGTTIGTDADLASLVQALIDEERLAGQALRQLAQAEKELLSGFESLLLEIMATDCEKHAHLLQGVRLRLEVRAQARTTRLAAPATAPLRRP